MSNPTVSPSSTGIGFSGLLLLTFIILKLCNVIAWSWWWVMAPMWIPLGIAFLALVVFAICAWLSSK